VYIGVGGIWSNIDAVAPVFPQSAGDVATIDKRIGPHHFSKCVRCFHRMVMREAAEHVVAHVRVRDVMVQRVEEPPVAAVHCAASTFQPVPRGVPVMRQGWVAVLEQRYGDQPEIHLR